MRSAKPPGNRRKDHDPERCRGIPDLSEELQHLFQGAIGLILSTGVSLADALYPRLISNIAPRVRAETSDRGQDASQTRTLEAGATIRADFLLPAVGKRIFVIIFATRISLEDSK